MKRLPVKRRFRRILLTQEIQRLVADAAYIGHVRVVKPHVAGGHAQGWGVFLENYGLQTVQGEAAVGPQPVAH